MRVLVRKVRGRRKAPNWSEMAKEVGRTMNRTVKPELIREFNKVVADWDHKPDFRARKTFRGQESAFVVYVFPAGQHKMLWTWVSGGTKGPYKIEAKNAPLLIFRTGYKPHTTPKPSFGGPGIATGPWVSKQEVEHPGIEARNFEKAIATDYVPRFRRHVENALRRGARRATR